MARKPKTPSASASVPTTPMKSFFRNAPSSLSVTVKGGNHFAAAYKKAAQPVAVAVTAQTKVRRQGKTSPADLKTGDLVNVQARACKADLAHDATPALTAVRVTAHAPATS